VKPNDCTRRDLLKLAAAGTGLLFLPAIAREAHARLRPDAPARRILILNLFGGIRSSAAFYASGQVRYNPWGLLAGAPSRIPLGQVLDDHLAGAAPLADADYTLGAAWKNERVARFREVAGDLSIIGTWDPERGDHIRARVKDPTGSAAGDQPGILTRIAAALAKEGPPPGSGAGEVPPFQLQPYAAFGEAGNLAQFAPVSLNGPRSLPIATTQSAAELRATGNDWARDDAMRERLDQKIVAHRARNAKTLADVFAVHRRASRHIGARLAEPWVNVSNQDPQYTGAAFGTVNLQGGAAPLSNAMLDELFMKTLGADGAVSMNLSAAQNSGLAIRLLQLGSPAVCMEFGSFDFHSQERTQGPDLYRFVGRLWATLNWLLKRIPDPQMPGRSLFDTTLVITMSDFARDPGSPATGYNAGEGSDHGNDPSCYYLAHAAMGGGVKGNRILSEISTNDFRGDRAAQRFDQRDLLAMLLWSIGLDPKNPEWGLDDVTAPLDGLFRA
jgi:uncharacterized protein (DUF1501 family)